MLTYPCKNRCKRVLYKQKPFGVKLAIELLITEDNMVQRYFNKQQRKELANLLSTKDYQQIFTNGKDFKFLPALNKTYYAAISFFVISV